MRAISRKTPAGSADREKKAGGIILEDLRGNGKKEGLVDEEIVKRSVRIKRATYEAICGHLEEANARSITEFIDKSLEFYLGYLNSEKSQEYLIKTIASMMDAKLGASSERTDGMLFKVAVEVAMQNRILANAIRVDESMVEEIREKAMDEVRRIWR